MNQKMTLNQRKELMNYYSSNVKGILEDMYLNRDWESFQENLDCLGIAGEYHNKEWKKLIELGADLSPLEHQLNSLLSRN
jgi:hypothetical protein